MSVRTPWALACVAALLAACSSAPPLEVGAALREPSPGQVVARPERWLGREVVWGGLITALQPRRGATRVQLLAYPLDSQWRPRAELAADSAFVAEVDGFLEPRDYAPGRWLTVVGRIEQPVTTDAGPRPALRARRWRLWPQAWPVEGPRLFFDFGFVITN